MAPSLDPTDHRLISMLQEDGRRPYTQLAKEVGLSEAAVRQRVQRLLESGTIQVVAVSDPQALGYDRQAMIAIRVDGDVRAVAERIAAIDAVIYLLVTAGPTDIICEVVAGDDEELLRLINDQIRGIPGVKSTETSIYLACVKQTYRWGAE
jgi:Lrp/AsnC family transcriptional regulator for asnA, asnC and gidA